LKKTLHRQKDVRGLEVCNAEGKIVRNTFAEDNNEEGQNIVRTLPSLVIQTRKTIRDLGSSVRQLN